MMTEWVSVRCVRNGLINLYKYAIYLLSLEMETKEEKSKLNDGKYNQFYSAGLKAKQQRETIERYEYFISMKCMHEVNK